MATTHRDTNEQSALLLESGIRESRQELIDAHIRIIWEDDEDGSGDVIAKIAAVNFETEDKELVLEICLVGSAITSLEFSKKTGWEIKTLGTVIAKVNHLEILEKP